MGTPVLEAALKLAAARRGVKAPAAHVRLLLESHRTVLLELLPRLPSVPLVPILLSGVVVRASVGAAAAPSTAARGVANLGPSLHPRVGLHADGGPGPIVTRLKHHLAGDLQTGLVESWDKTFRNYTLIYGAKTTLINMVQTLYP
jgi:hypothetical protein